MVGLVVQSVNCAIRMQVHLEVSKNCHHFFPGGGCVYTMEFNDGKVLKLLNVATPEV